MDKPAIDKIKRLDDSYHMQPSHPVLYNLAKLNLFSAYNKHDLTVLSLTLICHFSVVSRALVSVVSHNKQSKKILEKPMKRKKGTLFTCGLSWESSE